MDRFHDAMVAVARCELAAMIPNPSWAAWAARLAPTVAVVAVMAWLDAGQPDRERAAQRIGRALDGVIRAAPHWMTMRSRRRAVRSASSTSWWVAASANTKPR